MKTVGLHCRRVFQELLWLMRLLFGLLPSAALRKIRGLTLFPYASNVFLMKHIYTIATLAVSAYPTGSLSAASTLNAPIGSADVIVGIDESTTNSFAGTGYYVGGTADRAGTGGSSNQREHLNLVFGFTLPTLPSGETISTATLSFQVAAFRDQTSGAGDAPSLDYYILNTSNPDSSGTTFFQADDTVDADEELFVGTFFRDRIGDDKQQDITPPGGDVDATLPAPALAYLQSLYLPNGTPTQSEAFFRFNIDSGASVSDLDRYVLDVDTDVPAFSIETIPEPSSALLCIVASLPLLVRRRRA